MRSLLPKDPLAGLSAPQRREIREAVTRGEAVRDPQDAPHAVALAARWRRAHERVWPRRLVTLLMLLVLGLWIFRQADLPLRLGAVAFFAGVAFLGETVTRRTTRHAAQAEARNREVARLHRLEADR